MKQTLKFILLISITALMAGCRVALIAVEGGEVQYTADDGDISVTCPAGSVCIVDLEWRGKADSSESFLAAPDPGWFFHKWNAGERFLCGDSALPECHLDFEWIEDVPMFPEIYASAGLFYLMPVFKDHPRVTLGDEPRTITADGINQLWLQPADFTDYSYDQIAAVCPEGICAGTLPGSTIDLTGYFWASSEDVALLFLAYHQAGELVRGEFETTFEDKQEGVLGILHDQPILPGQILNCGIAIGQYDGESYYNGNHAHFNSLCGEGPASDIRGFWFWRPID
jgi:hypothetical protein